MDDALLGEGADLQIDGRRILLAQRQHRLHAHEADDGIDLHVGAQSRGARRHRHLQRSTGAGADVVDGEAALGLARQADGLFQRTGRRAHPAGEQGLVEVDVRLDQAGRDHPAGDLDDLSRRAQMLADSHDPAIRDGDVGHSIAIGKAAGAQQKIQQSGPIILAGNGSFQGATSHLL